MTGYSPADVTIENGYTFDATSQFWKTFCNDLPCDLWMKWIGYDTAMIEVEIAGEPAVIQCWKGLCEEFIPGLALPQPFGNLSFPGGVGAEVGVYRRDPHRLAPAMQIVPAVPAAWPAQYQMAADAWLKWRTAGLGTVSPLDLWWPADDLVVTSNVPVTFSLIEPLFGDHLISGYGTSTYWTCKWMHSVEFFKDWWPAWVLRHTKRIFGIPVSIPPIPPMPQTLRLEFSVAGVNYVWADKSGIHVVP